MLIVYSKLYCILVLFIACDKIQGPTFDKYDLD